MTEITRIFDLLRLYGHDFRSKQDLFFSKSTGRWVSFPAEDYIRISREIGLGLLASGIRPGTRIATVMLNSPEWNFFDMGIMMAGAIQVPIFPTIAAEDFRYILDDAGIEYVIIYNPEICSRVGPVIREVGSVREVFCIRKVKGVKSWKELTARGQSFPDPGMLERISSSIVPDDVATIIYTSGTTGQPKGVMLTHRNVVSNFKACSRIPGFNEKDRALSFLPLCHVYERMLNYLYQYLGMSVWYAESLDKVPAYLKEVRPDVFAAVPRVLEKMYNTFVTRGRNLKRPSKGLFFWAIRLGHRFEPDHALGRSYDLKRMVADLLVYRQWRKALGGHVRIIVCGSASLHPRLSRIFWAAGLKVLEGYGLTETSPVITVQTLEPGDLKFGTVGTALPGVEIRIAPDGEILCRGPNVMKGYYGKEALTAEVIDREGWFYTGDIGMLTEGKYLKITDRKKEIFKTSTGKYVAPQVIEQRLKESPFIESVMVIGENRKYVAALIVPRFEHLTGWCAVKKIPFPSHKAIVRNPQVIARIAEEVERLNTGLGHTEKVKKFRLLPDEWTVEGGEYSATLKLRRNYILEKYWEVIEAMYKSREYNYRDPGLSGGS
jgi:long-chain acyl-CoA synthetase